MPPWDSLFRRLLITILSLYQFSITHFPHEEPRQFADNQRLMRPQGLHAGIGDGGWRMGEGGGGMGDEEWGRGFLGFLWFFFLDFWWVFLGVLGGVFRVFFKGFLPGRSTRSHSYRSSSNSMSGTYLMVFIECTMSRLLSKKGRRAWKEGRTGQPKSVLGRIRSFESDPIRRSAQGLVESRIAD